MGIFPHSPYGHRVAAYPLERKPHSQNREKMKFLMEYRDDFSFSFLGVEGHRVD